MNEVKCPFCGSNLISLIDTKNIDGEEIHIYSCLKCGEEFEVSVEIKKTGYLN